MIRRRGAFLVFVLILILLMTLYFWTSTDINTTGTVKIYDVKKELLYESSINTGRKIYVSLGNMPIYLLNAVVSVEDETFWKNPGFSIRAIARALYQNLSKGEIVTGASTITQQLVRINVFSDEDSHPRSYVRKLREVLTAARMTLEMPKNEILERYLNEAYFGNQTRGVEAASIVYFDKPSSSLSLGESAVLAGIIASPERYNPFENPALCKERQEYVLDLMVKNGYISQEEAWEAKQEVLVYSSKENRNFSIKAPHFVHYVLDELATKYNLDNAQDGLKVYTTLDKSKYSLALEIARYWVGENRDEHNLSNAAVVLLNNSTGAIEVMVGGVNYYDGTTEGQINMAVSPRQPGSSIKPITYLLALNDGMTPATIIDDTQKVFLTKDGEGFTPRNYDNIFHGKVTLREALASSLNMPAVELLNLVGIDRFLDLAKKMGISTLTRVGAYDLALTLGGGEVTLLEESNMFATIARGGNYIPTHTIEKVTNDRGKILYQHSPNQFVQILGEQGEQISFLVSDILSDPKARMLGFGEKNPLVLSVPAAVKTGTTTDWHDVWTIGYTPDYTLGVWAGNNNNSPMVNISGVTGAAPIWHDILEKLLSEVPKRDFIVPNGISTVWVCKETGQLPAENCNEIVEEYFISGTEPVSSMVLGPKNDTAPVILNPENKAVYLYSPEQIVDQKIEFKAEVLEEVQKLEWVLNGEIIYTQLHTPWYFLWEPYPGVFELQIIVYKKNGQVLSSNIVEFEVKN